MAYMLACTAHSCKHICEGFVQRFLNGSIEDYVWERETLLDSAKLRLTIELLQERAREQGCYVGISDILQYAARSVLPRDRIAYLEALVLIDSSVATSYGATSLLQVLDEWGGGPAVKEWCRTKLPEVIVNWLPELSRYLVYAREKLIALLRRTERSAVELQELLLQGIERHVDSFDSEVIFALAGMVGSNLVSGDAARVVDWYVERLALRVPMEHLDQTAPDSVLPQDIDEAIARLVFSYMGDHDLRMRWRAAHMVRRLARTGDVASLHALINQYSRREDEVFRSPKLPFYWLAARLWFVIAWARVVKERPNIGCAAGPVLLQIALDETFPHVLVRAFARDACETLMAEGHLSLTAEQKSSLEKVNETTLPRAPAKESRRRHFQEQDSGRRFKFDWMDTLPYWYQPLLPAFSNVDGERFLQAVEHWIIDAWEYNGDIRDFGRERRRVRFENRDWALSSHRHGSLPTLERLNTHLEWHAMWCAVGELLKTEPLASVTEEDSWYELGARIRREMLIEPPQWAADLRGPMPLVVNNWLADISPIGEWVVAASEQDHRAEMFPVDRSEYLVVDGHVERRTADRVETISIASALTSPTTGLALIRALQTMGDSWDYKLPDEGEDHEIDEGSYRLQGWLLSTRRDGGIDEKDPLRGHALSTTTYPGRLVTEACGLSRDRSGGAQWCNDPAKPPMFVCEIWGERSENDERFMTDLIENYITHDITTTQPASSTRR
ncbi:hypothetical protein [Ralstonia pseudosolanacearum]|uniref:hypothetical protein n=1 Tax=Ralstonia pseudosolanacearum TaxID=1310165 RepID=UPI0018D1DAB7|nr:hypothetical protein [Ralstonia pseudosolanacearum]UWD89717.1 hypothetical protein NY025_18695 [Ralstonia pseudosolanacearum]CAH0446048.1 hypothetical protein LMG9673_04743 [Ralstonia pseudosolanacearum]